MKIHVVVLKTDKKGVASWESFLEEVNETEKQFRIVTPLPAKPEGKKLYMKTDEYVLRKKSAGVYITYGRDAAKLAETCFAPVFALVRKNDDSYEAEAVEKAEQTLIRKICMDILTDDYQMPPEKVTKELLNQCVREVNNGPDIIDRENPRLAIGSIMSKRAGGFPETGSVLVYTDGACLGNPGPGGWAAILKCGSYVEELHTGDPDTTNNRMELTGAIAALKFIPGERREVTLCSDSKYVVDGMSKGWAKGWRANGWRKADGNPAKNADLWDQLLKLSSRHNVNFRWVKGHSGDPMNERCDMLATMEAEKFMR